MLIMTLALSFLFSGITQVSATPENISSSAVVLPTVHSGESPKFHRVVALANGSAEIVAALGYLNILIGRDIASTMPILTNIPIDESGMQVSAEKVLSQKPDLILIDSNTSPSSALATFKQAHIPMVNIATTFSLSGIKSKEMAVANAIGTPKAGSLLSAQVRSVKGAATGIKVAFLYLRGTASIYLIGGKGSGADSLLNAIGVRDVGAENLKLPFNALSSEELIKLQPDVLLLMSKGLTSVGGISGLVALPGIAQTPAGGHKRVVTVDDSLLLSFGPRTVPMAQMLRLLIIAAAKL
jgi:iron complex transport system substrate-binding protein